MSAKTKIKMGKIEIVSAGDENFVNEETRSILEFLKDISGAGINVEVVLADKNTETKKENPSGVKEETVIIYDDAGIPSIMRKFTRVTNKELFGGADKIHPAFIIGGQVYDEIYISVYQNVIINGKPYSLPYQTPKTDITLEEAEKACFSKGEGWHLMTAPEWGLIANISYKNNTLPHGNTANGKYHADPSESGIICEYGKTLTGSGPATWTHNHKPDGVHDLCGNVWEFINGLRIRNGQLQYINNNDAALDIDTTEKSDNWNNILDDEGKPIKISVYDEDCISITTEQDIEQDYEGSKWENVEIECNSETLKELAIYGGEPNAYLYVDSTDGEYIPLRGGGWYSTAGAGVFALSLSYPRSDSGSSVGFRSAFYRKTGN